MTDATFGADPKNIFDRERSLCICTNPTTSTDPDCPAQLHPVPEHDPVHHPRHYGAHPSGLDCIDVTRGMTFAAGNAVKYVWRAELKNGRQNLEKALWYLDDAIRHADPIFVSGKARTAQELLDVVVRHEVDPNRVQFFAAIRYGARLTARATVAAMLREGPLTP